MSGRNYLHPQHLVNLREVPSHRARQSQPTLPPPHHHHHAAAALVEDPLLRRAAPPLSPPSSSSATSRTYHPGLVEDRIAAYQREIQTLLQENQRLAATHVALKQELSVAQKDLRHLAAAAQQVKAESDAEVRGVLEKSVKVEAEFRALESVRAELVQVREDVKRSAAAKEELGDRLRAVNGDLERARSELEELPEIKAEMESLSQDLQKGRAALEIERKTSISNNEHGRVIERNIFNLAREIEKLQAELANAEKKAAAVAAANPGQGYLVAAYANSSSGYGEGVYSSNCRR